MLGIRVGKADLLGGPFGARLSALLRFAVFPSVAD